MGFGGRRHPVDRGAGLLRHPRLWRSWVPAPGGGAHRCQGGPTRIRALPGSGERRAWTHRGVWLKRRGARLPGPA
ncbi:hypothetical protein NDU88_004238 [Pleurodeles waltl]|uniref:Uncharacterized protein n=1 Tax=Pleurodeles waltl TaxID=8319 RepID=A0AAV7LHH9_PLEWA|nr:hypothetical protein NDU88_004238 [Pleurodeles waltl]